MKTCESVCVSTNRMSETRWWIAWKGLDRIGLGEQLRELSGCTFREGRMVDEAGRGGTRTEARGIAEVGLGHPTHLFLDRRGWPAALVVDRVAPAKDAV